MARSLLERMAAWSQRRHWLALGLWVVVLGVLAVGQQSIGTDYRDDNSLPGTESQAAADALETYAPDYAGDSIQIVVHDDGGLERSATRERVEAMLTDVAELPHVAAVDNPYDNPDALSDDGTVAYATVSLDGKSTDFPIDDVDTIIETAQDVGGDGLQVELGGDAVRNAEEGEGGAEGIGILAALVILVLMFGSFLAASLPLITAIFAVGSTVGVIALLSNVVTVASYTAPLMLLVGLGVGIDYALLVFSRFRGELLGGADREVATRTALDTAGRSVVFAGTTVIIALLGLYALGVGALQGVALAVALTVLVTVVAALSLLPALLTLFGRRIERRVTKHAAKARHEYGERWRRWGGFVQRHPWPVLVAAVVALVALAAPALTMRLGFADAGTEGRDLTSRQAYDLLAEGFGPGFNGPLILVSEGGGEAAAEAVRVELTDTERVAAVSPPRVLSDGAVSTLTVVPDSAPQDEATSDLVSRLREDVLPPIESETGATYLLGGSTAAADDFASSVSSRMPLFLLVVVGLSAVLLLIVFRSVLVPLKAAVLNVLSIGASLGVVTVVFQEGWFGTEPGPVEAFVPVMIFAIVFGLSMDYEVFLVSRMHEEWRRTGRAQHAVREGLAMTGGVITAAAGIMIVVFGAFVVSPTRMLQQFGLGLAFAVLVDALVIRCLIVPAAMRLFGARAWWLPGWLDRLLPHAALERTAPPRVGQESYDR